VGADAAAVRGAVVATAALRLTFVTAKTGGGALQGGDGELIHRKLPVVDTCQKLMPQVGVFMAIFTPTFW